MKQTVLSGMRPTGELHLGHYFSVLKKWVEIQKSHDCYYMVADLHALTTLEETKGIKKATIEMTALWMAIGLDPKKSTIFVQSLVPEHGELNSIFSTLLPTAMLELNPVYKEMKTENPRAGTFGLLNYPVLQAADILLYKASRVPVGKDQEPHIEITREIARRFNNRFGKIFPEPHALFEKVPKIPSLQDITKKMSKSHNQDSYISLLDSPEVIRKKIKKAITDSGNEIKYNPKEKPAISNLLSIFNLVSGKSIKELEKKFKESSYAEFKNALGEEIINLLKQVRSNYNKLVKNPKKLEKILEDGSKKARTTAQKTLDEVKQKIGLF